MQFFVRILFLLSTTNTLQLVIGSILPKKHKKYVFDYCQKSSKTLCKTQVDSLTLLPSVCSLHHLFKTIAFKKQVHKNQDSGHFMVTKFAKIFRDVLNEAVLRKMFILSYTTNILQLVINPIRSKKHKNAICDYFQNIVKNILKNSKWLVNTNNFCLLQSPCDWQHFSRPTYRFKKEHKISVVLFLKIAKFFRNV